MARLIPVALVLFLFQSPLNINAQTNNLALPNPTPAVAPNSVSTVSSEPIVNPSPNEVKHGLVPSKQDIEMKERLENLSHLSDDQLTAELHKWSRYQQMSIGERGRFLQSIQELRDHRKVVAMARAKELNLNLNAEQQTAFEKSFWDKKLKAEKELWLEIEPRRKLLDEQVNEQLLKEFAAQIKKPNK